MSYDVTLVKSKHNSFQFDVEIEGAEFGDVEIYVCIEDEKMLLCFEAKRLVEGRGPTWVVSIPPLPMLKLKTYDFFIEAIIDNHYFQPINGRLALIEDPDKQEPKVKVSEPKNLESAKPKEEEKKEIKVSAENVTAKVDTTQPEEKKEEVKEQVKPPVKKPSLKNVLSEIKNLPAPKIVENTTSAPPPLDTNKIKLGREAKIKHVITEEQLKNVLEELKDKTIN